MLDTTTTKETLIDHLQANDVYRLTENEHLAFLAELEVISNLVTAAKIDAAAHAEERGLRTSHGCRNLAPLLRSHLKVSPGVPQTRDASYGGEISGEHAVVIADVIKNIPPTTPTRPRVSCWTTPPSWPHAS